MVEVVIDPLGECSRWALRMPSAVFHKTKSVSGFRTDLEINRCAGSGGRLSVRLGPDEWLLCAAESIPDVGRALLDEHHSLVDVSHRYAGFTVQGPQAHAVLAAGCPLDLDPASFAGGTATRTLLGKAEIVLWRLDEAAAYRVECGRSFAPYLGAFLQEAAREWRVADA
jgi:sarcosine oxidase, subunit gamma